MALTQRSGKRFEANIWPGFVDALTALVLILMFVLSIFMIVQFSLRETITGQSQKLNDLTAQLAAISDVLALERTRAADLESEVGSLRATLVDNQAETDRLSAALAALTRERDGALSRVAELEGTLAEAVDEREAVAAALAAARSEADAQAEAARLAAARREALEAMVAELNADKEAQAAEIAVLDADKAEALALLAALEAEKLQGEQALVSEAAERARLEQERAAMVALIDSLRAENADLTSAQNDLASEREEVEALRAAALAQLDAANAKLTEAEEARLLEAAAAQALREKLERDAGELDAITLALEEARAEAEQTLTLLAAAEAARQRLEDDLRARGQDVSNLQFLLDEEARKRRELEEAGTGFDREAALRKVAEAELAKANEQTAEQARQVALLNAQVRELNTQLASLQGLLDETAEREAEGQVQISNLGSQLNAALARKVALEAENAALLAEQVDELERVRSIFFERVEQALSGRDDIQRVGDRFVFQSEVLFGPGSATLGPAGRGELAKLGAVLRDVSADLPDEVNWILRVDGHTDRVPLSGTGRYRSNWELSQARALSVVSYLVQNENIPPERLAATGFGEFQPVDLGSSAEALARNRRIEFKFTER